MKKVLLIGTLFAFLLSGVALATETRVMTMGDANNIVKDDANISLYPSTINYYPKILVGEADPDDLTDVGANWLFGADSESPWILGTYFSTESYTGHDGILKVAHPDSNHSADHRIDLYYGRNFNEMPFGLHIGYYGESAKNEDDTITMNYEWALNRYTFGLGISPMEGKVDVALEVAMTSWTDKDVNVWNSDADTGLVDESKPSGNLDFNILARYWMDPMGDYTLIPHVGINYEKKGIEMYSASGANWELLTTYTETEMNLDLGLGLNYDGGEDVLVIGDFGVRYHTCKDKNDPVGNAATEDKTTTMVLPYFRVGIDALIFDWLDFRCGAKSEWTSTKNEPSSVQSNSSSTASTSTFLGAGFHWGNLTIDAEICTDFLENGPYFVSGEDDDLTEKVTLRYNFE